MCRGRIRTGNGLSRLRKPAVPWKNSLTIGATEASCWAPYGGSVQAESEGPSGAAEQSILLSSLNWLRSLDPVFQFGVGWGEAGGCVLSHEQRCLRPRITLSPKLIRAVHYICFFLLGVEVAKLSIKCGD